MSEAWALGWECTSEAWEMASAASGSECRWVASAACMWEERSRMVACGRRWVAWRGGGGGEGACAPWVASRAWGLGPPASGWGCTRRRSRCRPGPRGLGSRPGGPPGERLCHPFSLKSHSLLAPFGWLGVVLRRSVPLGRFIYTPQPWMLVAACDGAAPWREDRHVGEVSLLVTLAPGFTGSVCMRMGIEIALWM
jgi:hypothetical protein